MKRLVLLGLIATGVGVVALPQLTLLGRADAPAYRTAAMERGELIVTVVAAGTLKAVVQVDVGSQISGQIRDLYADFNSSVTLGQVIARIDPEIYEARQAQAQAELEVAQALVPLQQAQIERGRAELESAQAAHAVTKAQFARAEFALDDARREFERKRPLAASAVVSASAWEQTQNAYRSAQAQMTASRAQELSQAAVARAAEAAVRTAEAQLENYRAQVKQKKAILQQARIDLDHTYIRAPVTGTVVDRKVDRGQTVAASLQAPTLFKIAQDLTRMQVEASVVEADVGRFTVGQAATFTVDAYPGRIFSGEVQQIRKAPQVTQNVVTYAVVISTENSDQLLLPGMTANLRVIVARREGVLKVPNAALRFRPSDLPFEETVLIWRDAGSGVSESGGANPPGMPGRVFVVSPDGLLAPILIRLGATDGRMTEVMDGDLIEHQLVITGASIPTAGASRLTGFRLL
jgi:HlyD family secretion protein